MISEKVKAAVSRAALEAMLDMREQDGDYFHSSLEGWAELSVAVENVGDAYCDMCKALEDLFGGIKNDINREASDAERLYEYAADCAAECSSVMALCTKMIETKKNT